MASDNLRSMDMPALIMALLDTVTCQHEHDVT